MRSSSEPYKSYCFRFSGSVRIAAALPMAAQIINIFIFLFQTYCTNMRDGLLYGLSSHNNTNLLLNNTGKEAQKSQTFKCFCSPRTFVFVWMKLEGKLLISLLDITVCSFLGYTKDIIIVLTSLNPEKKKNCFVQSETRNIY